MRPTSILVIIAFLSACGAPLLVAPLALSPDQLCTAMTEGAAALPYVACSDIGLQEINSMQVREELRITVADTYRWAYGKDLSEIPSDGDTGHRFLNLQQATELLHKVLAGYGLDDPERFVLTTIETAKPEGYLLFATVSRESESFPVAAAQSAGVDVIYVTKDDPAFFYPYQRDADGDTLDSVVDWAALTTDCYKTQFHQAILLTMVADKIVKNQAKPGFWEAKEKWLAGSHKDVFQVQDRRTCAVLDIETGQIEPAL